MENTRRTFLKAIAASGAAPALLLGAAESPAGAKNVVIAAPESPLTHVIAAALRPAYAPRQTALAGQSGDDLLKGAKAVVLGPEASGHAAMPERIDQCTRGVYDLLQAAVAEGVGHVVYLSTLRMMADYPEAFQVDEDFAPRPTDAAGLPEYLGEFVCREFAREGKLGVVVLRLADRLDPRDAARAVRLALDAQLAGAGPRLGTWSVLHIAPGAKKAEKLLGYRAPFGGPAR